MLYLLDTNVCIAVLRGNPAVVGKVRGNPPGAYAVSIITYYELLNGVQRATHPEREAEKVRKFCERVNILEFGIEAAHEAAVLRFQLEQMGTPVGPYDVLIAAQVKAADLTLVTHNTTEFSRIDGLKVEDWE